jgi:hypothetical protein
MDENKWVLKNHPIKKKLSSSEARYWKAFLAKILKIGLEFEFNLPKKAGDCKGDNNTCPCRHMNTEDCWTDCIHLAKCKELMGEDMECPGIMCSGFVSKCVDCEDFEIACDTCENRYDKNKNPESIRKHMWDELQPSKSYGKITQHGVHSIVRDGSLLGDKGAEVVTVGRRIDFWEFYKMCKKIIDEAVGRGAYVDERCSTHAHVIASYYGKLSNNKRPGIDIDVGHLAPGVPKYISELERPMPEIILANFHQLCQLYQNAITWMTIGLGDYNKLTRWEKFRVSIIGTSPVTKPMSEVVDEISSRCTRSKYGWANYTYCGFEKDCSVNRLHIEMRTMDCLLSPSAVAAVSCLYYALMIKAVEVSKYGLIWISEKWLEKAYEVKEALMNNTGDWDSKRFSNTSNLSKYYEVLITESFDLLSQVKHILMKQGPAYDVLEKLADKPCALRLCDGNSWDKIERDLAVQMTEDDKIANKISEVIDLRELTKCKDEKSWISKVCKIVAEEAPDDADIEERVCCFIEKRKRDGEVIFLEKIGSMAFVE